MTDRYAVFGNPIKHSKSPQIHAAFAQQTAQDLTYEAICVPEDGFSEAVSGFLTGSGLGLNITIPFKQEAWAMAQQRSPRAELAGAVNTLYRNQAGEICGENTDGIGMVRDIIQNHGGQIAGKRVLILGAGGAVRGVLQPVLAEQPACLVIANRTPEKAVQLADLMADQGAVEGCGFDALTGRQFDLIINGTAASLQGEVPPLPQDVLASDGWCYDMMYGAEPTAFCQWAASHGAAKIMDGLGMLVEQAAESFRLWRGVQPATGPVIAQLRKALTV
ncbi:shikimate dehydrogenase [Neptuniibacter sp. CAU 1671]|uniref:shikimate dehydrogenase n=1 Tax=Neptuniibacter sp. CAU 1671 TaxID=3032593 RepID=UPI0023DBA586|nr:shikimate dehydrogenase [Neptuniibacter sp. CAU 1671]MDF2182492.1 shikimate dehydrogenase [Neptuniibacter sp. CAU 1671]